MTNEALERTGIHGVNACTWEPAITMRLKRFGEKWHCLPIFDSKTVFGKKEISFLYPQEQTWYSGQYLA
jgi:hypothetical protein